MKSAVEQLGEKILDMLDWVRAKPEPARWAILTVIVGFISFGLVSFWVWNLQHEVVSFSEPTESIAASKEAVSPLLSPLADIKKVFDALGEGRTDFPPPPENTPVPSHPTANIPNSSEAAPSFFSRSVAAVIGAVQYNWQLVRNLFQNFHF